MKYRLATELARTLHDAGYMVEHASSWITIATVGTDFVAFIPVVNGMVERTRLQKIMAAFDADEDGRALCRHVWQLDYGYSAGRRWCSCGAVE